MVSVEVNQMLAAAAAACEDKKAEDIRIFALDPAESGLSDYFLICTGTNDRQTVAITDEIEYRLKHEFGTYPNSVEGRRQGEWILMDYVDFIVHVFLPEKRAYYGLERLRPSATSLSIDELDSEIKAAITAKRPRKAAASKIKAENPPAKKTSEKAVKVAASATRKTNPEKKSPRNAIAGKVASSTGAREKVVSRKTATKKVALKPSASKKSASKKTLAKRSGGRTGSTK